MVNKCVCGICGSSKYDIIGRSHHHEDARIAGSLVLLEDNGYKIRECRSCHFRWKSPQLSYDEYLKYYKISTVSDWDSDESKITIRQLRRKQQIVERFVRGGRVLDIGCWRGEFLGCWGGDWEKFGIEPSDAGRKACTAVGIRVIGSVIADIPDAKGSFDVICMMDVLEHLPNPFDQLKTVVASLRPGGALVIETGDTDSMLSRVMGIDWHYYGAREHISFYCQRSLRKLLTRLGMEVGMLRRWPHMLQGRYHVIKQWHMALRFKWPIIRPRHLFRSLVRQRRFPKKEGCSPWLTGVNDHIFVVGLKSDR